MHSSLDDIKIKNAIEKGDSAGDIYLPGVCAVLTGFQQSHAIFDYWSKSKSKHPFCGQSHWLTECA